MSNQLGYLLGYLAGYQDGYRAAIRPGSMAETGSVSAPLSEPPHVRAIASRPVPTRPIPSEPDPGAIPPNRDQQLNGNYSLSAVDAEVARTREARRQWCWACDYDLYSAQQRCHECGAPRWDGTVIQQLITGAGVYILESDCGLAKIGLSRSGVEGRVAHLLDRARRSGSRCWPVACLPGAGYAVERWLHLTLAETRDPSWARDEGLPHPSEWFWPTPALRGLVDGDAFVDALNPEYIGGVVAA